MIRLSFEEIALVVMFSASAGVVTNWWATSACAVFVAMIIFAGYRSNQQETKL